MDDYSFLDDIKRELDAEREVDYSVSPERGAYLLKRYPLDGSDTPETYRRFKPEEFFDGSL